MPKQIINLIEPTLYDQTGHSYGYVLSLLNANKDFEFDMHVWLDRRGKTLLQNTVSNIHTYFFRPLRQIQKLFLYFKLIRRPETLFISTTELWDLKILAFYSRHLISRAKIVLHFHQFKQTKTKLAALAKIAPIAKNFSILTPTARLTNVFRAHGLHCQTVPCPVFSAPRATNEHTAKFNKILYAGAARRDKGFPRVISLLEFLRKQRNTTKFEIQISAPNSQRYDDATQQALQVLQHLPKDNVILHTTTLDQSQYLCLFNNAICLLLYDAQDYADKFSGVALDAFYAGCPIITAKDTWMGDVAEQYQAGIALDNYDHATIQQAAEHIINNYTRYHHNAKQAALELSAAHDPRNTLQCLIQ